MEGSEAGPVVMVPMKRNFTPIVVNKDYLFFAFILNMALVWTLGFSVATSGDDITLFSFAWTYRMDALDSRVSMSYASEQIQSMYLTNVNAEIPHVSSMLERAYDLAGCSEAVYEGDMEWRQWEISPTCNCIRNLHVGYMTAVWPNQTKLNENEMKNKDTMEKKEALKKAIDQKCFKLIRHTQVCFWFRVVSTNTEQHECFTELIRHTPVQTCFQSKL